jgi:hypothetical protein
MISKRSLGVSAIWNTFVRYLELVRYLEQDLLNVSLWEN